MSWFPELVVGTLSGVISGLVLQKIAPADSGIVLSSDESRRCQWVVAMSSLNASVGVR